MPIEPPTAASCGADAILVDARAFRNRSGIARSLLGCLERSSQAVAVGLRLDHRCQSSELGLAQNERVWTFLRHQDARCLAECSPFHCSEPGELVQYLHDQFGIAKLVVQLGQAHAVGEILRRTLASWKHAPSWGA